MFLTTSQSDANWIVQLGSAYVNEGTLEDTYDTRHFYAYNTHEEPYRHKSNHRMQRLYELKTIIDITSNTHLDSMKNIT